MSSPHLTKADSDRPPGPHRPEIHLVAENSQSPKSSPKESVDSSGDDHRRSSKESHKDATRQRFVLTDSVAFR